MLLGSASIVIGYLLGAFPAAYLIAKYRKGIDIREVGVRNMGAGNVMQEVGMWEGAVVVVADIGKGSATIFIAQMLSVSQPWLLVAGLAAILGHNFPVYIGFRGGKGVATLIGVFLVLSPVVMGITLPIIGIALLFTRHIFTSIAIAAPFFLAALWQVEKSPILLFYALGIVLFVLFRSRHRLKEVKTVTARTVREIKAITSRVKEQ